MSTLSNDERDNLVPYLDGELDEETTQALEAKLSRDPEARAELEELRQVYNLLEYLPRHEASPTFTNKTMEKLQLSSLERQAILTGRMAVARPTWFKPLAWVAGILLAAGLGYGAALLLWKTEPLPDPDEPLVRYLRAAEKWRLYEHVDDLDFARKLDHPDLFGDDSTSDERR